MILCNGSGGSRPSDKGEPGHPDPEIRGGGGGGGARRVVSKKSFFALRASVWSKSKGGPAPQVPPLDPPLNGAVLHG